jgi:hypothetical protein
MMNENFTHQHELYRMLLQRRWNVFGTLKFQPDRKTSSEHSHRLVRCFWNKLDRVIYGKAAELGCRVNRWCFAHTGSHSDNYHIHFVALADINTDEFCCLANTLWTKTSPETASIDHNWIMPVMIPDRVAAYLTREVWKLGPASFDAMLSADTGVTYQSTPERLAAQGQRISHAMTAREWQAANHALIEHKAGSLRRLVLRKPKPIGKAKGT